MTGDMTSVTGDTMSVGDSKSADVTGDVTSVAGDTTSVKVDRCDS